MGTAGGGVRDHLDIRVVRPPHSPKVLEHSWDERAEKVSLRSTAVGAYDTWQRTAVHEHSQSADRLFTVATSFAPQCAVMYWHVALPSVSLQTAVASHTLQVHLQPLATTMSWHLSIM